jgi:hypothetical protein
VSQLVGSRCTLCQGSIDSILEGAFCPTCGNPHHNQCRKSNPDVWTRCTTCGSDISALVTARVASERATVAAKQRAPSTRVHTAIVCLELLALPLLVVGALVFFATSVRDPDRDVALYISSALFGVVALIQVVVYGLHKGHSWARVAAMTLLVLALPSIVLPFAVLGLVMLANGQHWQAYVRQKGTAKL